MCYTVSDPRETTEKEECILSYVTFPKLGLDLLMNRTAFSVFGKPIYWYGIIIACGFAIAVIYAMVKCGDFGLNSDQITDYVVWGTIFGIIGARSYYVIFNFDNFRDNLKSVFYIWNGGIAIYGSVIGAFLTGIVVSKIKKLNFFKILDLASIGFLIGQIVGRWGNFVNAEAYGMPFASQNVADLPFWAMGIGYPSTTYVHPIFLYESLWNLLGLILILTIVKPRIRFGGEIMTFYFGWYGFGRFFTEGIRGGDELYFLGTNIRVSQMLAAILFVLSVVVFILKFTHKDKSIIPGMSGVLTFEKGTPMKDKAPLLYPEAKKEEAEEETDEETKTDGEEELPNSEEGAEK